MLKQILATAASAAALIATPAFAQTGQGPSFTPAEKTTLKTYQDFEACIKKGQDVIMNKAKPAVEQIVEARAKAANKATIDAAKASGMTEAQANAVVGTLVEAEAEALFTLIVRGEKLPHPACAKGLGISNAEGTGLSQEFTAKMQGVQKKVESYIAGELKKAQPKPKP
ncbi:MAG: hypothetical protein JWO78_382 [Micavibrio sp.]|nr:hypothetical protein [Micavibrio sp.]